MPHTFPLLIAVVAQCIVALDVTRIAVLIAATKTGSSNGGVGHGVHVFVGLSILLFMTIRAFRGHFSAEHHHGVEIGGIYWHFVDVMWIVVFATVYIL